MVRVGLLCRASSWATFTLAPDATTLLMNPWRRLWKSANLPAESR